MKLIHRLARFLIISLLAFISVLVVIPDHRPAPALAQGGSCAVSNYDVTDPNNWKFIGFGTAGPPCPCPPTEKTLGLYSPVGTFKQYSCSAPQFPPDKPGIDAGPYCIAGDTRTITLNPVTGDSQQVEINPGGTVLGPPFTFNGLQQGVDYTFRAQSSNSVGSSGWTAWTAPVQQDLQPPTTTFTPVGTAGTNGWWKSNVSVTLPAVDSGCLGVQQTNYMLDGVSATYTGTAFTVTGDGTHTLSYASTDGSHVEVTKSQTIKIDTVPPSISLTPDRPFDAATGWWRSAVTVTIAISDTTSGIASQTISVDGQAFSPYDGKPVTLSGDAKHTIDIQAVDQAGNTSVKGVTIPIDGTAPVSTISFGDQTGGNAWHTVSPVHVYVSATDNLSGVLQTLISVDGQPPVTSGQVTVSGNGLHWIDFGSVDVAGNVEQIHHFPVSIDVGMPSLGSVSCSASQIQPGTDFALTANLSGSTSGIWQVKLTAYPDGGQPFQVDAVTLNPSQQQTQVTLHFLPTSAQTGHYWFGLFAMNFAGRTISPGSLCSLTVAEATTSGSSGSITYSATKTPTPLPSSTPTASDTPTASATGTLPLTNTPHHDEGLPGGLILSSTATDTPSATPTDATPSATATEKNEEDHFIYGAAVLPTGDTTGGTTIGPNDNPDNESFANTQSGNSSGKPDLAGLLAQAALLAGTGATLVATAWSQRREDELATQGNQEQTQLQADLEQQTQQAAKNVAQNEAMVQAAQKEVVIDAAPSDFRVWYLQQLAKVPEWEHEVAEWNYEQAKKQYEAAVAKAEAARRAAIAAAEARAAAAQAAASNPLMNLIHGAINWVEGVVQSVWQQVQSAVKTWQDQQAAAEETLAQQKIAYQKLLRANQQDIEEEKQQEKQQQDDVHLITVRAQQAKDQAAQRQAKLVTLAKLVGPMTVEQQKVWNSATPDEIAAAKAIAGQGTATLTPLGTLPTTSVGQPSQATGNPATMIPVTGLQGAGTTTATMTPIAGIQAEQAYTQQQAANFFDKIKNGINDFLHKAPDDLDGGTGYIQNLVANLHIPGAQQLARIVAGGQAIFGTMAKQSVADNLAQTYHVSTGELAQYPLYLLNQLKQAGQSGTLNDQTLNNQILPTLQKFKEVYGVTDWRPWVDEVQGNWFDKPYAFTQRDCKM